MKYFLITLFLLGLLINQASSVDCSSIPIASQYTDYLTSLKAATGVPAEQITAIDAQITLTGTLFNARASAQSVTDLGICNDFKGTTCCTLEFVKAGKEILKAQFKKSMNNKSPRHKMLQGLGKAMKKCSTAAAVEDDLTQAKTKNQTFFKTLNDERKLQQDAVKAQIKFLRGVLCLMCVDPANIANYFKDGKIIVNEASYTSYSGAILASLEAMQTASEAFAKEISTFVDSEDSSKKCTKLKADIQTKMDAALPCGASGDCKAVLEAKLDIFGTNVVDELAPSSAVEVSASRILAETSVGTKIIVSTSGGANCYITDAEVDSTLAVSDDYEISESEEDDSGLTLAVSIMTLFISFILL